MDQHHPIVAIHPSPTRAKAAIKAIRLRPEDMRPGETAVAGIDQAVGAFIGVCRGANAGKMAVKPAGARAARVCS